MSFLDKFVGKFIDKSRPMTDEEQEVLNNILDGGKTVALTKDGVPQVVVLPYEAFSAAISAIDMVAQHEPLRQMVQSVRRLESQKK